MTPPLSIVIETFNATPESNVRLQDVLARLRRQSLSWDDMEILVVVEEQHRDLADFVRRIEPAAKVILTSDPTYYGMKRTGMKEARGDVVALLDSDCLPVEDWAREILSTISGGADVVAGRVRFPSDSLFARTFAVFDYGHLRNGSDGQAPCFNVSNAGLRREVARDHPFDARLTRFGGGTLLGRKLKSLGFKIVYNPAAAVEHTDKGVRKHLLVRFRTGHEAVELCRLDRDNVLPETKLMRFGLAAPFLFAARRFVFDCQSILANRRDMEIAWFETPYFMAASMLVRSAEVTGGAVSIVKPDYLAKRFGW
jgi:glycosyltransferase involved in cell wall biosynthesis